MAMKGHLFILRGDLKRLHCDAWLVPCGRSLKVEDYWMDGLPDLARNARGQLQVSTLPDGWQEGELRTFPLDEPPLEGRGWPWLTNVGYRAELQMHSQPGKMTAWFTEGLLAFVREWTRHPTPRMTKRRLPLLAVPLVGAGRGGGQRMEGELVKSHVRALLKAVEEHQLDIVLVTYSEQAFTAAQEARKVLRSGSWPLASGLLSLGRLLADKARHQDLVLFLGAGVSRGVGLPDWRQLLTELMETAGMTAEESRAANQLGLLDQARIVQRRLQRAGIDLTRSLVERFHVSQYGLVHALLAGLSVRESVTTNYDPLFEVASRACGHKLAVLPYAPTSGCTRWLLKLHGCVEHPEDIVLTREDYLRYSNNRAALAGIVQTLLLTKHMLFVGFSLNDDNFLRIVDDVRRALRREEEQPFGTALLLTCDPMLRELWEGELDLVSLSEDLESEECAPRRLEIFLDFLLAESICHTSYLLRPHFEGALSKSERALRQALLKWLEDLPPLARQAPAFAQLEQALERLGYLP
ncbi:MAG: SIR2 family protein [Candidatus Xenobia bacterium]